MPNSYRIMVRTAYTEYCGNDVRYATREEAEASRLSYHFTANDLWKIEESEDAPTV